MRRQPAFLLLAIAALGASALRATALETAAVAKEIDAILAKDWAEHQLQGNPAADDHTFVRRIYLDVVGRIPTTRETEDFLGSKDTKKRAALIDRLLVSEGYVQHSFNFWADVLRLQSEGRHSGRPTTYAYAAFIKQSLRDNKPYDQFVRELVTAQGKAWDNGAIGYYMRDRGMPLDNTANTARIFLGTRMECAQCHDHPFDKWTQMEFYQMAAFTYGTQTPDYLSGSSLDGMHELMRQRKHEIFVSFPKPVLPPRTPGMTPEQLAVRQQQFEEATKLMGWQRKEAVNKVDTEMRFYVEPVNFLLNGTVRHTALLFDQSARPQLPHDYKYDDAKPNTAIEPSAIFGGKASVLPGETRFDSYARWLTRDNARFNSVIADRLWKRAFGLSPIEPLDELLDTTKPMVPELQERLERLIVEVNYDMKAYLRIVYNTGAYQRQATCEEVAAGSVYHFTGPILRRMSAEQMWDSFVTLINPSPDLPDEATLAITQQYVLQGKKMSDSLDALTPAEMLEGVAAAGGKYAAIATDVRTRQKLAKAARSRANELGGVAKSRPDDAQAEADAAKARLEVERLGRELTELNNEARKSVIVGLVIPGQKKLYQKVTGQAFQPAAPKAGARPIEYINNVVAVARLHEPVTIPGYDNTDQTEAVGARRRERHEEEARYYGINDSDLKTYLRTRNEQSRNWVRAAEIKSPAPPGHYLREFGQSDRETIENANGEASVTQALAMMNGELLPQIMHRHSQLMLSVAKAPTPDGKVDAIYMTLLSRNPLPKERELWLKAQEQGLSTLDDLIFSLLNTQQFIFIQ